MVSQWMRALPGALIVGLVSGACQDAPLGPRAPAMPAPPAEHFVPTAAFSGRSADSLIDVLSPQWARLGHPEYRRTIDAWRQRELGTTQVSTLRSAPDPKAIQPSYLLQSGDETKPPPNVVSHQEALQFGSGSSVPNTVTAEMVFVGDQGAISLTSLSIASNSGGSYSTAGTLASGFGQLLYCVDISSGSCVNERRLNGAIPVLGAKCDAVGSGNIQYLAQNLESTSGFNVIPGVSLNTGGTVAASYALSAFFKAFANSCPAKDSTNNTQPLAPAPPDTPPPTFPTPDPTPLPPLAPPPPPGDQCTSYIDDIDLYVEVDCDQS